MELTSPFFLVRIQLVCEYLHNIRLSVFLRPRASKRFRFTYRDFGDEPVSWKRNSLITRIVTIYIKLLICWLELLWMLFFLENKTVLCNNLTKQLQGLLTTNFNMNMNKYLYLRYLINYSNMHEFNRLLHSSPLSNYSIIYFF